jgi:hypothetical protein
VISSPSITTKTNKFHSPNTLHQPNDEAIDENDGIWHIWKYECDDCMMAKKNCVKKTEAFWAIFPILHNSLDAINKLSKENYIWPSQMAKTININRKVKLDPLMLIFSTNITPDILRCSVAYSFLSVDRITFIFLILLIMGFFMQVN